MVSFSCSVPFSEIKRRTGLYYQWMTTANVYINRISFKAGSLVSVGHLCGIHPGYLRVDEASKELRQAFGLTEADVLFQLSLQNMTVTAVKGKPDTQNIFLLHCHRS